MLRAPRLRPLTNQASLGEVDQVAREPALRAQPRADGSGQGVQRTERPLEQRAERRGRERPRAGAQHDARPLELLSVGRVLERGRRWTDRETQHRGALLLEGADLAADEGMAQQRVLVDEVGDAERPRRRAARRFLGARAHSLGRDSSRSVEPHEGQPVAEVARAEAQRVVRHPVQPLDAGPLHPLGRALLAPHQEVEGGAYADGHRHVEPLHAVLDPELLLRGAEREQQARPAAPRGYVRMADSVSSPSSASSESTGGVSAPTRESAGNSSWRRVGELLRDALAAAHQHESPAALRAAPRERQDQIRSGDARRQRRAADARHPADRLAVGGHEVRRAERPQEPGIARGHADVLDVRGHHPVRIRRSRSCGRSDPPARSA